MKRLTPEEMRLGIAIQLRVLRGPTKTALQHVRGDQAADAVARLIIERCFAHAVVFVPDETQPARMPQDYAYWGDRSREFGRRETFPVAPAKTVRTDGRCGLCNADHIEGLALDLAAELWNALYPRISFDEAGQHRATMLLMANKVINRLQR